MYLYTSHANTFVDIMQTVTFVCMIIIFVYCKRDGADRTIYATT